ncbi:membrane protein YfhO [Pustulibacterium marinum]|uniref:Membrane protein YfhO n=1 Tax=Pustulibacterium marinum TaxID=1224947 RepID=A0A1I7FU84_9FLAO|nr:YfhO family protein [Pustulibacterium marinum]SFU39794.1 membrane protein YfhO [Pustulibacterium marinum]
MNLNINDLWKHLAVFVLFIIIPLIYFSPVLDGKVIEQSDIVQYNGMAKERNDYKKETGTESYWTDSAFGGMPTYQLGANYPHNYIKKLDHLIRFLPRPADYVFLYFLGFYVLMLVLKVDYRLAFLGSLAFGFSTYYIIILGVGHNAKAHAIAYFPMVIGGILMVFRKKYFWGAVLTAFAMALEISANHYQMTYYLLLLVITLGVVYLIDAFKKKELPHFFKSVGILMAAVIISILTNATNLLATQEYTKWSTRGKSELTFNADGSPKETDAALDKEYITQYSYGIVESLNLFVPGMFGGSRDLDEDSAVYTYLQKRGVPKSQAAGLTESLTTYWGPQYYVAGPAYIGAIVWFFFVLGLFLVKGRFKWWLVAGSILAFLLSWGKNLMWFTDLFIDFFPLYDKFRAVSSIQVLVEFTIPLLGIIGLKKLFDKDVDTNEKLHAVKWTGIILGGLCVVLFLIKSMFDFVGSSDGMIRQYYGDDIVRLLIEDRKSIYNADLFRSLIIVAIGFAAVWFYVKNTLKQNMVIGVLVILVLVDLVGVDKRYVSKDDFVSSRRMSHPFEATRADQQILKDTTHFRVFEPSVGLNGARTSYFHNSIGGYHAAKPKRLQDLYEYQLANGNMDILNMLNVKYVIQQNQEGSVYPTPNPDANGNAWFVASVKKVSSEDAEMKSLDSLQTKTTAVVNTSAFPEAASLSESYTVADAQISLVQHTPDHLVYQTSNSNDGLAVFSEMYYPHGWKVTLDGKEVSHFRVDFALRGMQVPAGNHTITFTFDPQVVKTGSAISLAGNVLLVLLVAGGLFFQLKRKDPSKE